MRLPLHWQENSFSASNKQAMKVTIGFLAALTADKEPKLISEALVSDSFCVLHVLKAETAPLSELQSSLATLNACKGADKKSESDASVFLGGMHLFLCYFYSVCGSMLQIVSFVESRSR